MRRKARLFEFLLDLVSSLVGSILDLVLGVLGSVVDFFADLAGRVASGATAVLDPDVVVQGCGISEPGDVGDRQVAGALVDLEEVVDKSNRRSLCKMNECLRGDRIIG